MRIRNLVAWPLVACLLGSCSLDGGSRGSGVTTAQGNVASVDGSAKTAPARGGSGTVLAALGRFLALEGSARAGSAIEGIEVSIGGTSTRTDADGTFSIRGFFDGPVTVVFRRAEQGVAAELPVNIPAAGTLTLADVHIDWSGGVSAASKGVDFEAVVLGIDCPTDRLTVASAQRSPGDTDTYVVSLGGSSLHDGRGNPLACEDLRRNDRLEVHGVITDDGTFGRADILRRG